MGIGVFKMSVSFLVVGCDGCSVIGIYAEELEGSGINLCE